MKFGRLFLALLLIPMLAVVGCEGDAGPAGPAGADGQDGVDGVDGNVTCLDCHSTESFNQARYQYQRSQHALGEYVDYAGGRGSCTRCHSGEGFAEFIETGDVLGNINVPIPIDCSHCHSVHTTFTEADFALRGDPTNTPAPWIYDEALSYDFESSANLCANCHQSRRPEPLLDSDPGATTYTITSTHYGPHHGAQANVQAGMGWAEIEATGGRPYTGSSLHGGADCIDCHMGAYSETTAAGGHTWWPNPEACAGCHTDWAGQTGFDRNGFQTTIQGQLDTLRDLLVNEGAVEFVEADQAYEPVVGTYDMIVARAFFNWTGLNEDRSKGLHNPSLIRALLDNSIKALQERQAVK